MIKVTLEFKDAGEALSALFKLYGEPVPLGGPMQLSYTNNTAAKDVSAGKDAFADFKDDSDAVLKGTTEPAGEGTGKGKAGRPKGSRNKTKDAKGEGAPAPQEPKSAADTAPKAVPAAAPVAPSPAAPTAPTAAPKVPSLDDTAVALDKVLSKHGLKVATKLLADFGATRLRDLAEDKRSAFVEECYKLAALTPQA